MKIAINRELAPEPTVGGYQDAAPDMDSRSQQRGFRNEILAALPAAELALLQPHMASVRLVAGQILHEPGERISNVFFIEHGLASVMALTDDHQERLEIGLIGREGMTGLQTLLGSDAVMFNSLIVQAAGEAYRVSAPALHDIMQQAPALRRRLFQSFEVFFAQVSQTAVCNSQHVLHRRLARWLLAARDRASKDDLPLTQEFLAVMLGVQRPRVTLAVDQLGKAGLVTNRRGHIVIQDRAGLEAAACPCYARLRSFTANVLGRPSLTATDTEEAHATRLTTQGGN